MNARRMLSGEFPEDGAQEVRRGEFIVAVGRDQQATRALNAPAEKAHEIECGFVGPVQILQHHDAEGVRGRQPLEQPGEELIPRNTGLSSGVGEQGESGDDFIDRPQDARGLQSIGVSPQHACGAGGLPRKFLDQRTLAGARFAAHERYPAGAGACFAQMPRQFIELKLAFQKVHGGVGEVSVNTRRLGTGDPT